MPRITRVTTRTGDDGTTSLGGGERVSKDALRIAASGTVDELNAWLGWVRAAGPEAQLDALLREIQNDLFDLGSDLCALEETKAKRPVPGVEAGHVARLESLIDELTASLPALSNFVLPGGSPIGSALHVARTVCRRAERQVVSLAREETVGRHVLPYLNRLSDALFVLARQANRQAGAPEDVWNSRR